jgi:hypothetical protein
MTGPEDRPTEPLRPRAPVAREAVVATEPAVDPAWAVRIDESLRNLKGLMALLTVLSLVGIGLAVWALMEADGDGDQTGASRERVASIDDRVDRLESEVGDTDDVSDRLADKASKQAVADLRGEVDELRTAVEEADSGGDTTAIVDAVEDLGTRVDQLEQDVADLQAQQSP